MGYSKKDLQKLLKDDNITTTAKSIAALLLTCLDNGIITREEVFSTESKEPKPMGRPRKYPPKEVKPKDPKYDRLLSIRNNPTFVNLTNVDTGEVTSYPSLYKASRATNHGCGFFDRNNGKVINGIKYEIVK